MKLSSINLVDMEKKNRRSFDKSFKLMVVELYCNGKKSTEISEEHGICSDLVRRWIREFSVSGQSVIYLNFER
jgi:transposase